jgi:uncharacterized integral membrane protein
MVRFLRFVIFALAVAVLLFFAFANRHDVLVSFDPFAGQDGPAFSREVPLFAVMIASGMLGVVAGAFATWLSQGRHRRALRQNRAEADKWRAEAQALKAARAGDTRRPALRREG